MRFILAAGIWCMQPVNNGQSHNHCPGEGEIIKREGVLLKHIRAALHTEVF